MKIERIDRNTIRTINAAIEAALAPAEQVPAEQILNLVTAANCALADLEGIMPQIEPSGERHHPGWQTIEDLRQALGVSPAGSAK